MRVAAGDQYDIGRWRNWQCVECGRKLIDDDFVRIRKSTHIRKGRSIVYDNGVKIEQTCHLSDWHRDMPGADDDQGWPRQRQVEVHADLASLERVRAHLRARLADDARRVRDHTLGKFLQLERSTAHLRIDHE